MNSRCPSETQEVDACLTRILLKNSPLIGAYIADSILPVRGILYDAPGQEARAALFYEVSLEDHVPQDHLLWAIDPFVDLRSIRGLRQTSTAMRGVHQSTLSGLSECCLCAIALAPGPSGADEGFSSPQPPKTSANWPRSFPHAKPDRKDTCAVFRASLSAAKNQIGFFRISQIPPKKSRAFTGFSQKIRVFSPRPVR